MRNVYRTPSADASKLATDRLFTDPSNQYRFSGPIDEATRFIERVQLLDAATWQRFVNQFRSDTDSLAQTWRGLAWRCEYWGKMMRGACFTYAYTKNPELYATLTDTVRDMLDVHRVRGRLSTYAPDRAYDGWDMWGRKYVLLGMEYFYEICEDDALRADILDSLCRQADDIMSAVGDEAEGKKPINSTTRHWRGMNSSSILEPFVRLYTLTGKQAYFDFATYIVSEGGSEIVNIFDLAHRNKLYPYQYPLTKAYEMISCFEGLLEYYRVTGIEKHRQTVIRFADRVLESDFTIIGCAGCTHELFDHSTVRQANTNNGRIQQETCVTVTLMKFMYQLTCLTGDPKYVDAFETSLYNAYLGAVNTEKQIEPTLLDEWNSPERNLRTAEQLFAEALPFDSYNPLTAGTRGNGIGGLQFMSDGHYYGCCACIGAAGFGLVPKMTLLSFDDGLALNLYFNGEMDATTPGGKPLRIGVDTAYPVDGRITVTMHPSAPEAFTLKLRIPAWSHRTSARVCGVATEAKAGYLTIDREWHDGDTVTLDLDMTTYVHRPIPYGHQILMNEVVWEKHYVIPTYDEEDPMAKHHVALTRGPLVLAQENRLGYSVDEPADIKIEADGTVAVRIPTKDTAPYAHILELGIPLQDGSYMTVTDYASAGKLFSEESKMAAWMLTK